LGESFINLRSTPNVLDGCAYYGMVQKDYGTTLFATGTGAALGVPINLIYEADFGDDKVVEVFTHTSMYKYTSSGNTFVVDSPVATYTGTFTDFWSACMHNNDLIYSNGVDLIQAKLTYNSTGTTMASVVASSYKANVVVSFANHLNIYRTTENGVESPKRVRWTQVGALGLTGTDWTAGTAGFVDITDMEGSIITAEKIGNAGVAIYGENSIHMQEWVGGTDVYRFTKMITNLGTPCRRGVIANDTTHYMLGRDNVYMYNGGRDLTPIGDAIKPQYVADISQANIGYSFLDYIKAEDELRVYIPTGTSTQPDVCYVCKIKDNYAWYKANRDYTAKGMVTDRPSGLTIGELVGDIGAQNWKFGDYTVSPGAKLNLLADASGYVVKMDKTVYSLSVGGTQVAQTFIFDTKDISSINDVDPLVKNRYNLSQYMDNQTRWYLVKIEAKGSGSMYVEYSTDAGSSWSACNPAYASLTPEWAMYLFEVDTTSTRFMIRIKNSATNEVVHVRYMKVQFIPGSEV
jgi:hypothetical protein